MSGIADKIETRVIPLSYRQAVTDEIRALKQSQRLKGVNSMNDSVMIKAVILATIMATAIAVLFEFALMGVL